MATLLPETLTNLIRGMENGEEKPTGEHRSSLLQVTDIVPAELDENLWPVHGFFIKLSDSSHSLYATLPLEEHDLVLTNRIQLGQFLYIDRLLPASPVPVIKGANPIPGRHPLLATPHPIISYKHKIKNHPLKRSSWDSHSSLDFDNMFTPKKDHSKTENNGVSPFLRSMSATRRSANGGSGLLSRMKVDSPLRKSCVLLPTASPSSFSTSKLQKCRSSTGRSTIAESSVLLQAAVDKKPAKLQQPDAAMNFPGKLGLLEKEAIREMKKAQKVLINAQRDASATEALLHCLKLFTEAKKCAKADAPSSCFSQFLEFHTRIKQLTSEKKNACSTSSGNGGILKEIEKNKVGETQEKKSGILRRFSPGDRKKTVGEGKANELPPKKLEMEEGWLKIGKGVELESGLWFMDFIEKAMVEKGGTMKKTVKKGGGGRVVVADEGVSHGVMLKVINWVEVEQCGLGPVHPKAMQLLRKLRIRLRNP